MLCSKAQGNKGGPANPFAKKEPKPTRARLVSLLDPLGRKRYGEVERFLATVDGATSGLHYYDTQWGWAVRYLLGSKDTLCTLHLLPGVFEATVALNAQLDLQNAPVELAPDLRRRIARTRPMSAVRWVRVPIRGEADYENFQKLVRLKASTLRAKVSKAAGAGKPGAAAQPAAR